MLLSAAVLPKKNTTSFQAYFEPVPLVVPLYVLRFVQK
jgi:hypothetical protein